MDRKELLLIVRHAKSAHIQWRSNAQALIAGYPTGQDQVPVGHMNCKFGKWYYGAGQQLSFLNSFSAIHAPHKMMHKIYKEIFTLLFEQDDRSSIKKIFGSSAKLKQEQHEEVEMLLQKMLPISEKLLEKIEILMQDIKKMSDKELADLG